MRLFALSLVIVLLGSARLAAQADPVPIKSVATWEDLLKQPKIDLGDGIKIRLGIDSLECPQWSGVTLYAYTEGFDDMKPRDINRDALGPVWVSVRFGDASFDAEGKHRFIPRWQWQTGDKQPRLLCRFLMVDKAGDYQVTVRTEKGKDIAQVTFKGTDSPFHPWSPLLLTKDTEFERLGDLYTFRRIAPAKALYEGKGIALPNMKSSSGYTAEGWSPWEKKLRKQDDKELKEKQPFPFGKGPLPIVLPQDVDPSLQLKFSQDNMLVRIVSKDQIDRTRPDWRFLCRWWVNGKPFMPEQVDPIPRMEGGSVGYPEEEEDLQIELKITPKALKAKSGDKVELQLLHCPSGWLPVKNPQTTERAGPTRYPRLTNKISFKLP
jgi:hypothetical protein